MSLADELERLDSMRQTGVISDKDFLRAKEKLLKSGQDSTLTAEKAATPSMGMTILTGLTFGLSSGISTALSFVLVAAVTIGGIGAAVVLSESLVVIMAVGAFALIIGFLFIAFIGGGIDFFG
ncbi:MAG: hypothetical protein AAF501_11445 [Pseudomonadota bacterium]